MKPLLPGQYRQGIDYGEKANVQDLHAEVALDEDDPRITIKPFSLRILIVCGLAFFFAGFFSARYGIDFTGAAPSLPKAESGPVSQTLRGDANPASTTPSAVPDAAALAVVHVVIRNMKFDPPNLEVKKGDTVEWKNDDITPHTATSPTFDSGSIDPDKSWRHTFTGAGSFPYACTFHPDMKGALTVK